MERKLCEHFKRCIAARRRQLNTIVKDDEFGPKSKHTFAEIQKNHSINSIKEYDFSNAPPGRVLPFCLFHFLNKI